MKEDDMKPKLNYQQMHQKAKRLVEESVQFLGESYHTAGAVMGKTMQATKLHYQSRRDHLALYRTLHDLGAAVTEEMRHQSGEQLHITTPIKGLFGRIIELEKEIAEAEKKISSITIVAKESKTKKNSSPLKKEESSRKGTHDHDDTKA